MGKKVMNNALILFLKYPERKMVKTRIAAKFGDDFAFGLYTAFIKDLLVTAGFVEADKILAIDGPSGAIIDSLDFGTGYPVIQQNGKDIGERMLNAFIYVFNAGYNNAVLIGSDLPGLPAALLENAFAVLNTADAVIGRSTDGGYYLIGFRKETCSPDYFQGIKWSASSVFQRTMDKFSRLEKNVYMLPEWIDIDDHYDLKQFYERNSNKTGTTLYTMKYLTEAIENNNIICAGHDIL
jgi:rSAM/selenodomain-associated transferase 1